MSQERKGNMMVAPRTDDNLLSRVETDTEITHVDVKAIAVLNRSEVETQLDAAHRYPRSIARFLKEALSLATLNRHVAESCIYALPRGGKTIAGPSVRLAEIVASAYGNLHIGSRVVDAEEKEVVAQGIAWDLEKNLRVTVEARRRITNKYGKRYDDDMITVTGAAAASVAIRNAVFRVVPRAYVDSIYEKVRETAVGDAKTLASRREDVVGRLQKIGVPIERIFVRVGGKSIEDIGLEGLEVLIGLGTAIKNREMTIDVAFPPIDTSGEKSKALETELLTPATEAKVPTSATAKEPAQAKSEPKPKGKAAKAAPPPPPDLPDVEVDPETGEIVPPPNAGDAWEGPNGG